MAIIPYRYKQKSGIEIKIENEGDIIQLSIQGRPNTEISIIENNGEAIKVTLGPIGFLEYDKIQVKSISTIALSSSSNILVDYIIKSEINNSSSTEIIQNGLSLYGSGISGGSVMIHLD